MKPQAEGQALRQDRQILLVLAVLRSDYSTLSPAFRGADKTS